jgi:hypothetical protein
MKNLLFFLISLLFPILIISCGKGLRSPKATYTIKGKLISRNDGRPIADFNLIIKKKKGGLGLNGTVELGNTHTDEMGMFYFSNIRVVENRGIYYDGQITTQTINLDSVPKNGDTVDVGEVYINR